MVATHCAGDIVARLCCRADRDTEITERTMIMRFFAWLWMKLYGNIERDIEGWPEESSREE